MSRLFLRVGFLICIERPLRVAVVSSRLGLAARGLGFRVSLTLSGLGWRLPGGHGLSCAGIARLIVLTGWEHSPMQVKDCMSLCGCAKTLGTSSGKRVSVADPVADHLRLPAAEHPLRHLVDSALDAAAGNTADDFPGLRDRHRGIDFHVGDELQVRTTVATANRVPSRYQGSTSSRMSRMADSWPAAVPPSRGIPRPRDGERPSAEGCSLRDMATRPQPDTHLVQAEGVRSGQADSCHSKLCTHGAFWQRHGLRHDPRAGHAAQALDQLVQRGDQGSPTGSRRGEPQGRPYLGQH